MTHIKSKGLVSAKKMVPVLRRCCFMVGLCENLAITSKDGILANAIQNRVDEITHASTNTLVRAPVWRRCNELLGAAVLEKTGLLRHHKLLHARM